jgi:hypothetical protein
MKSPGIVIMLVTLYLLIFKVSPYLGIPDNIILLMFAISPFLVIYMVYVVLKFGKPSSHSFEERFYEDIET